MIEAMLYDSEANKVLMDWTEMKRLKPGSYSNDLGPVETFEITMEISGAHEKETLVCTVRVDGEIRGTSINKSRAVKGDEVQLIYHRDLKD